MAKVDRAIMQMVRMDQDVHKGAIVMSGEYRGYNRRYKEIVERDYYGARKNDNEGRPARDTELSEDIQEDG